jgi:hypothetical protein
VLIVTIEWRGSFASSARQPRLGHDLAVVFRDACPARLITRDGSRACPTGRGAIVRPRVPWARSHQPDGARRSSTSLRLDAVALPDLAAFYPACDRPEEVGAVTSAVFSRAWSAIISAGDQRPILHRTGDLQWARRNVVMIISSARSVSSRSLP